MQKVKKMQKNAKKHTENSRKPDTYAQQVK